MSGHLSDEELFANADSPSSDVRDHVADCASCAVRFRRLSAGARLIDAVRNEAVPAVDWKSLDSRIMAAAESAAAEIRAGSFRREGSSRRAWGYGAVALAAAAATVFVVRARSAQFDSGSRSDVATHAPTHGEHTSSGGASSPVVAVAQPVEGVVLMVAAPVHYDSASQGASSLTGATAIRAGGHLAVDEHGGRAVISLHGGFRLDARSGSDVRVARLDTEATALALTKGEARIDGPASETTRMTVDAGGWTLRARGGAFVAKLDADVVRVRVMSGKVGVSRAGGVERDVLAGDEIELTKDGDALRVVSHAAHDGDEIDASVFSATGTVASVPTISERGTLSVAGRGSLPAGTSEIRVASPVTLQMQSGNESWSMVVDPSAANGTANWRRIARPVASAHVGASPSGEATATAIVPANVVAANGTPEPTAVNAPAVVVAAQTPAQAVQAGPAPSSTGLGGRAALEQELSRRSAHCFVECAAAGSCPSHTTGRADVSVDPDADGHVQAARVYGFESSASLTQCIAVEARALRVPSFMIGTQMLHVTAPNR